ncbi:hypothetical protein ACT7CZ_08170 [Bacillus cereus]
MNQKALKFYIQKKFWRRRFQKALNTYMSHDRKTAKMTIILDVNPYSKEAMPVIEEINKTIDGTLNGTELKSAKKAIGGTTARNVDLKSNRSRFLTYSYNYVNWNCDRTNRHYTFIIKHHLYYWIVTISVLCIIRDK